MLMLEILNISEHGILNSKSLKKAIEEKNKCHCVFLQKNASGCWNIYDSWV